MAPNPWFLGPSSEPAHPGVYICPGTAPAGSVVRRPVWLPLLRDDYTPSEGDILPEN